MAERVKETPLNERKRFFVQRTDYGRYWSIVIAVESDWPQQPMRLCFIQPSERTLLQTQTLQGNEFASSYFTREEAQELIDAMWEAGLRPTRR